PRLRGHRRDAPDRSGSGGRRENCRHRSRGAREQPELDEATLTGETARPTWLPAPPTRTAHAVPDVFARGDDMRRVWRSSITCALAGCVTLRAAAQTAPAAPTWQEIRDRFRATNPTLQAGRIGIDESKAAEITAYLRPNPQWTLTLDQVGHTDQGTPFSASN